MKQSMTGFVLLLCAVFAGCATEIVRPGEQPQASQTQRMGVVESVRDVQIDGGRPATGAGAAIGAVVGGLGGSYAEQAAGRRAGLELTVRLDEGRTMVIAQAQGDGQFKPGDRVRVVSDGATAHVYHQQ